MSGLRAFVLACVYLTSPLTVRAATWTHVTAANNVELAYYMSQEATPGGQQPFIYVRLKNNNVEPMEGAVGLDVTCSSGAISHVGFDATAVGVIAPGQTFGGFPHLYKAVCKVGDSVERVDADVRFTPVQSAPGHAVTAAPEGGAQPSEPMPTWVPDTIPPPEPPPDVSQGPQPWGPPVGSAEVQQPPSDKGLLVEVHYGLAALAVPVQGTTVQFTGFSTNYTNTAGGLGPRITLDVWPYYSPHFSVGFNALLEFDSIGISDGFAYATNVTGGLRLQTGSEAFISALLKVDEGFRAAEASQGSNADSQQSDASFSGAFTRFAVDGRLCVEGRHPYGPCHMGVDVGVGYDLLNYASNHGAWFVEAAYWSRNHFAVTLEYGWDYPAGGNAFHRGTPWTDTYASFGLAFSDAFFNGYGTPIPTAPN